MWAPLFTLNTVDIQLTRPAENLPHPEEQCTKKCRVYSKITHFLLLTYNRTPKSIPMDSIIFISPLALILHPLHPPPPHTHHFHTPKFSEDLSILLGGLHHHCKSEKLHMHLLPSLLKVFFASITAIFPCTVLKKNAWCAILIALHTNMELEKHLQAWISQKKAIFKRKI